MKNFEFLLMRLVVENSLRLSVLRIVLSKNAKFDTFIQKETVQPLEQSKFTISLILASLIAVVGYLKSLKEEVRHKSFECSSKFKTSPVLE